MTKKRYEKRGMPLRPQTQANARWSMDFVSDRTRNGSSIRILTVIDEVTRECLALEVDSSLTGRRVCAVLNRIALFREHPLEILTDNGPEFTQRHECMGAYDHRFLPIVEEPLFPCLRNIRGGRENARRHSIQFNKCSKR